MNLLPLPIIRTVKNRYRKNSILNGIFLSFLSQAIAFLLNIISVPILLEYLGKEQYGIWITVFSIISWLTILDLGLGNGLRNYLTEHFATNNSSKARSYISTTYLLLGGFILLTLLIIQVIIPFIDWITVFRPKNETTIDFIPILSYCLWGGGLLLFIRIITSILQAQKKVGLSHLLLVCGSALAFIGLLALKNIVVTNKLPFIAILYSFSPPIILLFYTIYFFKVLHPELVPTFRCYDKSILKNILGLGFSFFFSQLLVLALNQSSSFIITQILAPADVTIYYIPSRLFSVVTIALGVISSNLLPHFTEAHASADYSKIMRLFKSFIAVIVLLIVFSFFLFLFSDSIFGLWINNKVHIPKSLVFLQFLLVVVSGINSILSTYLNGIGKIKAQLPFLLLAVIILIPASIFLGKMWELNGITLAIILAQMPITLSFLVQTLLNLKKEKINSSINP